MRLVPYPTLIGEASLVIDAAWLDDRPLAPSKINYGDRIVALNEVERSDWEVVRLAVRLEIPSRELSEEHWADVRCVAVLSDRQTNVRQATVLSAGVDGAWTGEVVIHRDLHHRKAQLTAQVVATVEGVPGRQIGTAEETWTINLEAASAERPRLLQQIWVDFSNADQSHLHPFKGDPWTIDATGVLPIVYLNRGFEGLQPLLASGRAADQTSKNVTTAQLGVEIWTTLFHVAAQAVRERGAPAHEWQDTVLREMLPEVFPDRGFEDGLRELKGKLSSATGAADLHRRALRAAFKRAQFPRLLGEHIRIQLRSGEEN
jgi:hypothetical protein